MALLEQDKYPLPIACMGCVSHGYEVGGLAVDANRDHPVGKGKGLIKFAKGEMGTQRFFEKDRVLRIIDKCPVEIGRREGEIIVHDRHPRGQIGAGIRFGNNRTGGGDGKGRSSEKTAETLHVLPDFRWREIATLP